MKKINNPKDKVVPKIRGPFAIDSGWTKRKAGPMDKDRKGYRKKKERREGKKLKGEY